MKNPKIIYITISAFCVIALLIGIYAQFFVKKEDRDNMIIPNLNHVEEDPVLEKTQEEIKTQFNGLFTNQFYAGNYQENNIQKLDESKKLVYTAHSIEEKNENYEVKIDLPVMNINSSVANSFNSITQNIFVNKATEILNNRNSLYTIYSVSYTSYINGEILSLVIQSTLKEGSNPQRVIVQTYNYDLATGQKVELVDMLTKKNIIQSEAHKKINETVEKAKEDAQVLVQSGYPVYNRDLSNTMYQLKNVSTYFLGPKQELYIIFAYGNNNYTSEMDIVWYQ